MAVGEYSVDHYQSLPTLEAARAEFTRINGDQLTRDVFKDFFINHGMDRKFGLSLLHRHFDLSPGEMLVDYDGTSVPWAGVTPGMNTPQPAVWAYSSSGDFRPTKFHYSKGKDPGALGDDELHFMNDFKKLLDKYGATDVFGLCRYPGDGFRGLCEITHGRANVNLKPADWPDALTAVDTAWFFSDELWQRGCRCLCNSSAANHPRGAHVYTTSG